MQLSLHLHLDAALPLLCAEAQEHALHSFWQPQLPEQQAALPASLQEAEQHFLSCECWEQQQNSAFFGRAQQHEAIGPL